MTAGRIIVLIDETTDSLRAVEFALNRFNQREQRIVAFKLALDHEPIKGYASEQFAQETVKKLITKRATLESEDFSSYLLDVKTVLDPRFTYKSLENEVIEELCAEFQFADVVLGASYLLNGVRTILAEHGISKNGINWAPQLAIDHSFESISNLVFINNHSAKALYSIKQFCYLFPDLCSTKEITLLNCIPVDEGKKSFNIEQRLLSAFLQTHTKNLAIMNFKHESVSHLKRMINTTEQSMIICSSDTKSYVEELFSYANTLLIEKPY